MATKDSNISTMNKNKETIKKVSAKVHEELLNTSHLFIDETVATLSRIQKITGKVIKKSEPILEKQIEITFDAVEALTNQASKGGKRALKLFGLTKQYNKLTNTISETIDAIPSTEKMVKDTKEFVANAKSDVEDKIEEIGKMVKIGEIKKTGSAKVVKTSKKVGAKTTKAKVSAKKIIKKAVSKTETILKSTAKKAIAKKTPAKKVAAKKITTTKISAKTPVIKNVVKPTKKATVITRKTSSVKASVVKTTAATKAKNSKANALKAKVVVSELTQIKGIGASLAAIMADNGIKTIKDLQIATPTALKIIATKAGNRYKAFDTKNWITAAKAIAK